MKKKYIVALFLSFIMVSCSVTKRLDNNSYLLASNDLKVYYGDTLKKEYKIGKGDIKGYIPISQVPNTKVFGYNLSLRIYQMAKPDRDTWGNRVLRKIGQAPVLFDSTENRKAMRNLQLYMESEGFYNAKVTDTVIYKNRRAYVTYKIDAGYPYFISSYKYNFTDTTVMPYVLKSDYESIVKKGMVLKQSLLENERLRIANTLQNNGFYFFSVGSIDYLVDTTSSNAAVTVNVNKRIVDRVKKDHKQYKIGDITVQPSNQSLAYLQGDKPTETIVYNDVSYDYPTTIKSVRPKNLSRLITIAPGDLYSKEEVATTKNKLSGLSFFRSVNLDFQERPDTLLNGEMPELDCDVKIVQELKQGFKTEAEISTNNNYSGFSLTFGYTNKNIFRGGESMSLSVTGGYDIMHGNSDGKNSWEIGGNISFSIPRLLAPIKSEKLRNLNNISTQFEALINSQRRPYYDRTITSLSYGYSWNSGKRMSYSYRPVSVSLIDVPRKNDKYINSLPNPYLRESYNSQLIAGSLFSVYYKQKFADRHTLTVRTNVETSGNLLYLGSMAFHAKKQENEQKERYYKIFNIKYSQYLRTDLTFTYEIKAADFLTFAYRLYGGGGYCYGNSNALPIERQFYAGGGSSMRGWQLRTLGPGNVPEEKDAIFPNQLGNIRLETNLEARFPIYKIFHGALFFDLGNIWSNVKGENNKEARFYFNRFYKQLAFNTGLGVRLDFDFFVVRMDWGVQLYNPGWAAGHRWVDKFEFKNTSLHFGIGYPF